ncbi:TetR/AcrR family transcriptional regulator [Tunturiibacter gelidiferens]|uniref:TetR/AcrR family transcriptional regulator n=1 Tax=Tunturiibacter gelidiferens TaxID=3069689 RepID=UPI003D9B3B8D
MLSTVPNSVRVEPQQERSARRLANFLDVAEVLFVEIGYEATTMTAIAERSGSGIGTLYHYFPDKQSLAFALFNQYTQKVEAYWKPLIEHAETLSHTAFAETFLERVVEFLRERPAYLQLLAAPIRFSRDPAARRALRIAIANAFRAKDPSLASERAMLAANISLQMVKGMTTLYAEASLREKPLIIAEFKKALTLYLGSVFSDDERSSTERRR